VSKHKRIQVILNLEKANHKRLHEYVVNQVEKTGKSESQIGFEIMEKSVSHNPTPRELIEMRLQRNQSFR
jgi:hypothetical protein